MKRKWLLFPVACCFAACINESLFERNVNEKNHKEPMIHVIDHSLTQLDLIRKVAEQFCTNEIDTRSNSEVRQIKEIIPLNRENNEPSMYIVNFMNNKGWIIVSATTNYTPVLAFNNTGNFNIPESYRNGIKLWFEETDTIMAHINQSPDSVKASYQIQWLPYMIKEIPISDIATTRGSIEEVLDFINTSSEDWISDGYQPIALDGFRNMYYYYYVSDNLMNTISSNAQSYGTNNYGGVDYTSFVLVKQADLVYDVDTMVTARWGQDGLFRPLQIPTNRKIGCQPVAMGQIMNYWKYPTIFDWENITDGPSITTSDFLHEVGLANGIDYTDPNGTSGATTEDAVNAFHNYGYTNATKISHNINTVLNNLNSHRPVFMRGDTSSGEGHAWVCDGKRHRIYGYEIVLKTLQSPSSFYTINYGPVYYQYPNIYLHYNWGYEGNGNGFYYYNTNPSVNGNTYNYNRAEIVNIYH